MNYAISDIHGRYDLYLKMLSRIQLSDKDRLYIIGDICDRGEQGLKTVLDIAERDNVSVIMGNHDFTALSVLTSLDREVSQGEVEGIKSLIAAWKFDGGDSTYNEYRALTKSERALALMTIDSFSDYGILQTSAGDFVMCHGGIGNYEKGKPLYEYSLIDLAFTREDYSKPKFTQKGKYLVTGHTPTAAIDGATEGRIYRCHDHIAIDCGAVFGFGLGCICLDTMEEFYVK